MSLVVTPSDLSTVAFTPAFTLGTRYEQGSNGFVYVQFTANSGLTRGTYVLIGTNFQVSAAAPGTARGLYGFLLYDIPASVTASNPGYGWVQIKGQCVARLAAGAAGDPVFCSTTSGQLTNTSSTGRGIVSNAFIMTAPSGGLGTIYLGAEFVISALA